MNYTKNVLVWCSCCE